jgi:aspartyl-tRNA(Asn)/glutamyl-tRNA(Gln) amidotransferase subunit B
MFDAYETVIGLEVHAQLLTETKLFSGDSAAFGGEPNSHISPITLGHPGTLPMLNKKAVELAVRMGIACNCSIAGKNVFARKNYFYPDLPKGYQISQHTTPICSGGGVPIKTDAGQRIIKLNRIHLEEDAGKSLHDVDDDATCLDYNRAGVALIEIVTEPELNSGDEAFAFLTELRKLLRWLRVCDGNMEEGSMRCDANISVRPRGAAKLGTKVEVKNLNSIRNVRKAIEFEAGRLRTILEGGGAVQQETRSFDAATGTTFALRSKEEANDYRYFTDPDITPFIVSDEWLNAIRNSLPELPEQKAGRYVSEFGLSYNDAKLMTDDLEMSSFFEQLSGVTGDSKASANWMMGPVRSYLNDNSLLFADLNLSVQSLAGLISLVESGKINFSTAANKVLPSILQGSTQSAHEIAASMNLFQDADSDAVNSWVEQVLNNMPDKVKEYKKGKKGLIGLFVGEVKKVSKGKADPKLTNELLLKKLES